MKRKRLGGLAVALALGLGVTSVVPAPVAAAVEAGWSDEMSTGEVVQGDEWTQEIVTNFYSGEIQKVIYGKYYWLGHENDGAMKTGWQTIGGKKYNFGSDGALR